jgi:DNA-binding FadR family transcriptional regulator
MVDFGEISLPMLLEARQEVVESTVRLAAERASKADIAALRANLDQIIQLSEAGKFGERLEKAVEFYTLIATAAGNTALSAIVESLGTVIKGFLLDLDPAPYEMLVAQHKRVIDCLADQDASGAVKAVRSYLQDVTNYLLKKRTPRSVRVRSASKAISAGGGRAA